VTYGIGACAIAGVEYFFKSNISLSAEYGADLKYGHEKVDAHSATNYANSGSNNSTTANTVSFSSRSVRFGLSVYF